MPAELAQRSSRIVGILWHQGESDSKTIEDVRAYKERFFTMLDALTARLGLDERTPVILGEVCEALRGRWPYVCEMNETLREIASVRANLGSRFEPQGLRFRRMAFILAGRPIVSREGAILLSLTESFERRDGDAGTRDCLYGEKTGGSIAVTVPELGPREVLIATDYTVLSAGTRRALFLMDGPNVVAWFSQTAGI